MNFFAANTQTKKCPKCERELALTGFAKNKTRSDGLQVYCRACLKQIRLKSRLRKPPATKTCPKCKETFPSTNFWRNNTQKDRLQPYCKPCNKAKNDAYRSDPVKRDRMELTQWVWREDNRERYMETARIRYARYREKHREELRLRSVEYRKQKKLEEFRKLLISRQPAMR